MTCKHANVFEKPAKICEGGMRISGSSRCQDCGATILSKDAFSGGNPEHQATVAQHNVVRDTERSIGDECDIEMLPPEIWEKIKKIHHNPDDFIENSPLGQLLWSIAAQKMIKRRPIDKNARFSF